MKPGDKVKVVTAKNDRIVGRVGTILGIRGAYPKHIKIHIPGVPRQPGNSEIWFLAHNHIELVEDGTT